jgi:hypothetical protein
MRALMFWGKVESLPARSAIQIGSSLAIKYLTGLEVKKSESHTRIVH